MALVQCTFFANTSGFADGSAGLRHIGVDRVIIASSTRGSAISLYGRNDRITLSCCDLWGNANGDWTTRIADQYGIRGNISLDPGFCAGDTLRMVLGGDSPCLPPNTTCDQIGAWGQGCDQSPAAVPGGSSPRPAPSIPRLVLTVQPNPSAGGAVISFSVPPGVATALDLVILDPAGRRVRALVPGRGSAGPRAISWDGRSDAGRPVPGGIYFVRLRLGEETVTRRLVVIR